MTIMQGPCPECGAFWPVDIIACTECGWDETCVCCYLHDPKLKEVACYPPIIW